MSIEYVLFKRRCKITAFNINKSATKYVEKHVYGGG